MKVRKKYFKSKVTARSYQRKHKRMYGYRPALFTVYHGSGKVSRYVAIPNGLKDYRRYK